MEKSHNLQGKKVVLAHPARQHSFQLAKALERGRFNYKYITTVYLKRNNKTDLITRLFLKGESKNRAKGRRCDSLKDSNVIQMCEVFGLLLLLFQRLKYLKGIYLYFTQLVNYLFSKKLVKYIIRERVDLVILFDLYAYHVIKELKKKGCETIIVLDMSAPNYDYMAKMFMSILNDDNGNKIVDKSKCKKAVYEIDNSDFFLVASDFTRKSLSNTADRDVFYCRYGINSERVIKSNLTMISDRSDVLFIGRLTRQKGFHNFINLSKKYQSSLDINFRALGSYNSCDFIDLTTISNVSFEGHVEKEAVYKYLDNAKLLVMPSLSDGYGFVVLEAMARGVIVICSNNTGASDLIEDKVNGFVFETGKQSSLYSIFNEIITGKYDLEKISKAAINKARKQTWQAYEDSVLSSIESVFCK